MANGVLTATATITCGTTVTVCDPIYLTITDGGYSGGSGDPVDPPTTYENEIHIFAVETIDGALTKKGSAPSFSCVVGDTEVKYYIAVIDVASQIYGAGLLNFSTTLTSIISYDFFGGTMNLHSTGSSIQVQAIVTISGNPDHLSGTFTLSMSGALSLVVNVT